ncbi:hypothetical protein K440DRAFT_644653 [Wilcoxina mikolae CBS 423.85]|nr:hypothetical protein K440DRAFT_644653 [Wilcoxina mikolae CBS 423.85]
MPGKLQLDSVYITCDPACDHAWQYKTISKLNNHKSSKTLFIASPDGCCVEGFALSPDPIQNQGRSMAVNIFLFCMLVVAIVLLVYEFLCYVRGVEEEEWSDSDDDEDEEEEEEDEDEDEDDEWYHTRSYRYI